MRTLKTIDKQTLDRVIGGVDMGGIMQAASPLLGMIPGIGPIASAIMPMIGQLTSKGGAQPAAPQGDPAAAQQAAPQAAAPQLAPSPGGGGGGGRHRPSVSVSVGSF
jgi:hypothetical protein